MEHKPKKITVPRYLKKYYWWAYILPLAVWFWDHIFIVNLILYGNYSRLRDEVLTKLDDLSGSTLQISCCYGDLTPKLVERAAEAGGHFHVIDILKVQLDTLRKKLSDPERATLIRMDARNLELLDDTYDRVLIFFLFHEQPREDRVRTMREALRVLKPGGELVIVDFATPHRWHPIRFWLPFLGLLEPFAWDLWKKELADIMPGQMAVLEWTVEKRFGGLFQILVGREAQRDA